MGLTFIRARVVNPAIPDKAEAFNFLVDSGAIYTVLPKADLDRLGIPATGFRECMLADGQLVRRDAGNAFLEYEGITGAAPVVFGDPGVYLIGATALESWGVMLDPLRRELKALPMTLMRLA